MTIGIHRRLGGGQAVRKLHGNLGAWCHEDCFEGGTGRGGAFLLIFHK